MMIPVSPPPPKRYPRNSINSKKVQSSDIIRQLNSGILLSLPLSLSTSLPSQMLRARDNDFDFTYSSSVVPAMEAEPEIDTPQISTMKIPLHCMFEPSEEEESTNIEPENDSNYLKEMPFAVVAPKGRGIDKLWPSSPPKCITSAKETCMRTSSKRYKKKLTLSAYRKPEETVRLTDCDTSRQLENEYNLRAVGCKVIGHGAYSTVRSAMRHSDGMKVAIKSLSKFDALRARRLRRPKGSTHADEWEIMKLLQNNPYVLTLFDVFETDTEIHLVTEFCRGGELFDAIKRKGTTERSSYRRGRFMEPQAARITNHILKALVELHALGIVHRDIKAENILLLNSDESDIQVKLCDFGMARLQHRDNTPANDSGGETTATSSSSLTETASDGEASPSTPGLLFGTNTPPEGFHGNRIGPATDIFSLGVTLYILLCGFSPVFCEDVVQFPDAYWNNISIEAKDVVRSMLHHDSQERITAVDALENAWIRQQTTRVRRGSISANLELVRARLIRSLGEAAAISTSPLSTSVAKRSREKFEFVNTNRPKRTRICSLDIPFGSLRKRDVRVIEERVVESHIDREERGDGAMNVM